MAEKTDVIIIGAGASGLMCAMQAGNRRRKVLILDHARRAGQKILISGGGRCNFTNRSIQAENYISRNPHFCRSALSRYTPEDFLNLVHKHHIGYSEKARGELFCDNSSRDILDMLLAECRQAGAAILLGTTILEIEQPEEHRFKIISSRGEFLCSSLVVATGGLALPAAGASPLGYEIARQFHINVWPQQAGLVPFTLQPGDKEKLSPLAGIAVEAKIRTGAAVFCDSMLFTRRGLSGPAILQLSSYWRPGEFIIITLLPGMDLFQTLVDEQQMHPKRKLKSVLTNYLPKRLVAVLVRKDLAESQMQSLPQKAIKESAGLLQKWVLKPGGTEGYRTAEVTLGGVDCDAISSKTMEAQMAPGLYFTGEVLDVAGWLGGYNLQWAWSSGWCAGQYV